MTAERIAELRERCASVRSESGMIRLRQSGMPVVLGVLDFSARDLLLALDEREALLTALKAVAAELGDARSTLSHCWASEKAPTKEDADDADTAEEAARAAIKKASE